MKTLLAATALSTALIAGSAVAADLSRAPVPYPSAAPASVVDYGFNWAGGYVGANLGYRWVNVDANDGLLKQSVDSDGVFGGLQAGYNWQINNFVYGLETDIGYGKSSTSTAYGYDAKSTWEGTTRARLGYAFDKFLVYGTGGLAYADLENSYAGVKNSGWQLGWAAGAGVEYAINKNVSLRGEYLYTDYGSDTVNGAKYDFSNSLLRFGVNYKF
jgi:outer membrane immunogenic protein